MPGKECILGGVIKMRHEFDHQFFREISKYETGMFLQVYANLNSEVYKHKYSNDNDLFHIKLADYGLAPSGVLHLNHWTIRDIIFQKFRRGHVDGNGLKSEILQRELYRLIGLYNDYENELSKKNLKGDSVFFLLYGIAEQQFRGQINIFQIDKKRNDIIFNKLDTENFFDVELIVNETLGMTRQEFRLIMMILLSGLLSQSAINPYRLKIDPDVFDETEIPNLWEKYNRVIKYYTVTKDFVIFNNLNLTRYKYLFVEYGETCVLADGYMLEEKFADAELWLAREFYQEKEDVYGKGYFPNRFGILFERYIEYVAKQEGITDRLFNINNPDNMKRFFNTIVGNKVDYVLETEGYRLIIECKSGIKPVAVKDAYTNVEALLNFMKRVFDKGAGQINTAIQNSRETEKIIVGVIVHAEKAFMKSRIKQTYLTISKQEEFKDILLFDIHDFEILMSLLKENPVATDEIIHDYINNETDEQLDFIQVVERKYRPSSFLDDVELFEEDEFARFLTEEALKARKK